ncbi:MAG: serine hydrolase domain-containing protein [Candidatus Dormibacteria bacterium]
MDALTESIERCREHNLFSHGVALYVSKGGHPLLSWSSGMAADRLRMSVDTPFRVSCAAKPILAYATAALMEEGVLSLDTSVRTVLGRRAPTAEGLLVRHLLNHTSGYADAALSWPAPEDSEQRLDYLTRAIGELSLPVGWKPGQQAAYSVALEWQILGAVVEKAADRELHSLLRSTAIELGMATAYVGMDDETFDEIEPSLGSMYFTSGGDWTTTASRDAKHYFADCIPGDCGVASAKDLASMYESALGFGPLGDTATRRFEFLVSHDRGEMEDLVDGGTRPFGLGLTLNMSRWMASPQLSTRSFGHAAYSCSITGLADPTHGLAIGLIFNDVTSNIPGLGRRRAILDLVMSAVTGRRRVTRLS